MTYVIFLKEHPLQREKHASALAREIFALGSQFFFCVACGLIGSICGFFVCAAGVLVGWICGFRCGRVRRNFTAPCSFPSEITAWNSFGSALG